MPTQCQLDTAPARRAKTRDPDTRARSATYAESAEDRRCLSISFHTEKAWKTDCHHFGVCFCPRFCFHSLRLLQLWPLWLGVTLGQAVLHSAIFQRVPASAPSNKSRGGGRSAGPRRSGRRGTRGRTRRPSKVSPHWVQRGSSNAQTKPRPSANALEPEFAGPALGSSANRTFRAAAYDQ